MVAATGSAMNRMPDGPNASGPADFRVMEPSVRPLLGSVSAAKVRPTVSSAAITNVRRSMSMLLVLRRDVLCHDAARRADGNGRNDEKAVSVRSRQPG